MQNMKDPHLVRTAMSLEIAHSSRSKKRHRQRLFLLQPQPRKLLQFQNHQLKKMEVWDSWVYLTVQTIHRILQGLTVAVMFLQDAGSGIKAIHPSQVFLIHPSIINQKDTVSARKAMRSLLSYPTPNPVSIGEVTLDNRRRGCISMIGTLLNNVKTCIGDYHRYTNHNLRDRRQE